MTWMFPDPPNVAVITDRAVLERREHVCYVSHEDEDGMWQFLSASEQPRDMSNARVVGLEEMLNLDPSLVELHDLPLGWTASRTAYGKSWIRKPS